MNIYVGQLPYSMTEEELREMFIEYGEIGSLNLIKDKFSGQSKGFGFIAPDEGGNDVFVHISAVKEAGLQTLDEGQKVEYELVEQRGKTSAGNLKAL